MKKNFTDLALLILRVAFSGMMLTHGIPKFQSLFVSPIRFADPFGLGETFTLILAVIGEAVAPLLVIIGLKTKWASIPVIITMAVAAFMIHASDPIGKKELALLYFFAFTVVFLAGPGKYSIDGYKK